MSNPNADDDTWEYLAVLNECIQILLTIGIGALVGYFQFWDSDAFLPQATKFVFYVALPLHILKGLGIGVDFYDDSFLWIFIVAFLVLRAIALVFCFVMAFTGGKNRGSGGGIGQVAVMWLALTWISTIILGVPIAGAVFGDPAKGRTYGILAAISSFIFQLPLELFLLECHALELEYIAGIDNPQMKRSSEDIAAPPETVAKAGKEDPEQPLALDSKGPLVSEEEVEEVAMNPSPPDEPEAVEGQPTTETPIRIVTLGLWIEWACTWAIWKKIFLQLTRNPVLWGIVAGFFFSLTTIGPRFLNPTSDEYVPGLGWIFATTTWLGDCVSPMALIAMGVWMQARGSQSARLPLVSAFLYMLSKLIVLPLLMLGLAKLFNFNNEAGRAAVLMAALPISMASFSLADRYGIGQAVLSENVALGTALILPTIILWNMALDALDLFPIA